MRDCLSRYKKVGMRFGDLYVKEYLGNATYLCECLCGNEIKVKSYDLRPNNLARSKKHCGCKTHKVKKNEEIFDSIDNENSAYILGFIAADGHVLCDKSYGFEISLNEKDINLLEKIKDAIGSDANIRVYEAKGTFPNGSVKISRACRLSIHSKKIGNRLKELGFTENKSLFLDFDVSQLSEKLFFHFLRGVWDGDGSIICYKREQIRDAVVCNLVGCKSFLTNIKEELEKYNIHSTLISIKGKNENYIRLTIKSQIDMKILLEKMYNNATIYLDRKFEKKEKALEILNKVINIKNSND